MRHINDHYEYIGVYVDDLIVAAKDPQQIFATLKDTCSLRLKGVEPLRYHLGCNFFRDPDGTLCQSAEQYVERMHANYTRLFNEAPKHYKSPLEPNDHPFN